MGDGHGVTDPTAPRAAMRPTPASGAGSKDPPVAPGDGALLGLALWLADVAAEASRSTPASAEASRPEERADESPAGGRTG